MLPEQKYTLPDPYPVPRVLGENRRYALLLQEAYAGAAGELTAINQYIYHSITLEDSFPAFAYLTRQVAICEMRHFELLGKTIVLLGLPPMICRNQEGTPAFWTSKFVYYGESIDQKLAADIKHEMDAIDTYREQQQYIRDPYIRKLLERITLDEEYHLRLFLQVRDQLNGCCL